MTDTHRYDTRVTWPGADAVEPFSYDRYPRTYTVTIDGKPPLTGSAGPAFHGDRTLHNPEDLFVAALSACHMLTYLALCARRGLHVIAYEDAASGTLALMPRPGRFTDVVLRPKVTLVKGDVETALRLHDKAHEECFIASSVRVPVRHEASIEVVR